MADEFTWKELGGGILTILGAVLALLYRGITGEIREHREELDSIKKAAADVDTRLKLLEQRSADQHAQLVESLNRIGDSITDWRQDATVWRKQLAGEIGEINKRISTIEVKFLIAEKEKA